MPSFENGAMKTFVSMWLNKPERVRLFASKILNESLFQNVKAINNTNNLAQNMPAFTDNYTVRIFLDQMAKLLPDLSLQNFQLKVSWLTSSSE